MTPLGKQKKQLEILYFPSQQQFEINFSRAHIPADFPHQHRSFKTFERETNYAMPL